MSLPGWVAFVKTVAAVIEFVGSLILCGFLIQSLQKVILNGRFPELAQRAAAQGIIFVLDFKLAATLLKTLILVGWDQIAAFVLSLAIRWVVKRQMTWQEARLLNRGICKHEVSC